MQKTDLVIIGSGPSGYTAAIYSARARLNPVLYAGEKSGGQLMWTTDIENFPGFPQGVAGPELMMQMRAQAERFGTTIHDQYVTAVDFSARPFKLWTHLSAGMSFEDIERARGDEKTALLNQVKRESHDLEAEAVIISTGASSIMVGVPGEMEFMGRGVSTCAVCDAAFYREKDTFVVGGGDSAMEDTMALTKFAKSVTVLHRRDSFKASKIMQERVLNDPKVKVMWNTTLEEVRGEQMVTEIVIKENGIEKVLPAEGVFVAIGHRPITDLFEGQVALDAHRYVVTRQSVSKAGLDLAGQHLNAAGLLEFPSMTSVEGVFAAGDVVDVRYKQAITAAGQGCAAALDAERWLESHAD